MGAPGGATRPRAPRATLRPGGRPARPPCSVFAAGGAAGCPYLVGRRGSGRGPVTPATRPGPAGDLPASDAVGGAARAAGAVTARSRRGRLRARAPRWWPRPRDRSTRQPEVGLGHAALGRARPLRLAGRAQPGGQPPLHQSPRLPAGASEAQGRAGPRVGLSGGRHSAPLRGARPPADGRGPGDCVGPARRAGPPRHAPPLRRRPSGHQRIRRVQAVAAGPVRRARQTPGTARSRGRGHPRPGRGDPRGRCGRRIRRLCRRARDAVHARPGGGRRAGVALRRPRHGAPPPRSAGRDAGARPLRPQGPGGSTARTASAATGHRACSRPSPRTTSRVAPARSGAVPIRCA